MGVTNIGNQTASFKFEEEAKSEKFNVLNYKLFKSGVYDGFTPSYVNATSLAVSSGTVYIEDEATGLGQRISTADSVTITVSPSAPYIVCKLDWANVANNYMDIESSTEADITSNDDWIVITKANFVGASIDVGDPFTNDERELGHRFEEITDTKTVHGIRQGTGGAFDADSVDGADLDTSSTLGTNDIIHVPTTKGVRDYVTTHYTTTIQPYVNTQIANFYPIGVTWMFDGAGWVDNSTLTGWYACIPANAGVGCPDLVYQFIKGASNGTKGIDYGVSAGNTDSEITISSANLPTHVHDDSHGHTSSGGSTVPDHNHTGTHPHTHNTEFADNLGGTGDRVPNNEKTKVVASDPLAIVSLAGFIGDATPEDLVIADEALTITTTVTVDDHTGDTGDGGFANTVINIDPQNYSVIFIRKCV